MEYDPFSVPLTTWLQFLRYFLPPSGILLIGAGTGSGSFVQMLRLMHQSNVILVEADDAQYLHLKRNLKPEETWQVHNVLVSPHAETSTFYKAGNPSESGLIEPELLQNLWPNLKTIQKCCNLPTVSVEELLRSAEQTINWLFLDCLPAAKLLEQAGSMLEQIDLLVLRVLIDEDVSSVNGETQADVQARLNAQGFRLVITEQERHPALAHVLYVRDPAFMRTSGNMLQQELALAENERVTLIENLVKLENDVTAALEAWCTFEAISTERQIIIEQQVAIIENINEIVNRHNDSIAALELEKNILEQEKNELVERQKILENDLLSAEQCINQQNCRIGDGEIIIETLTEKIDDQTVKIEALNKENVIQREMLKQSDVDRSIAQQECDRQKSLMAELVENNKALNIVINERDTLFQSCIAEIDLLKKHRQHTNPHQQR